MRALPLAFPPLRPISAKYFDTAVLRTIIDSKAASGKFQRPLDNAEAESA
jgi:hypothetical protein